MSEIHPQSYFPSDMVVETRVGDESVIMHLEKGVYYGLDPLGTRIWEQIKAGVLVDDICSSIAHDFDVSIETVRDDVQSLLADLLNETIIRHA